MGRLVCCGTTLSGTCLWVAQRFSAAKRPTPSPTNGKGTASAVPPRANKGAGFSP